MNNLTVIAYLIYLIITISVTIFVGRTLFNNGKIFLYDIFHQNKELADSVNRLLLIGFYLINVGYVVFATKITRNIISVQSMFETLSIKIGIILFILGIMHFLNIYIFFNLRKKAQANDYSSLTEGFIV